MSDSFISAASFITEGRWGSPPTPRLDSRSPAAEVGGMRAELAAANEARPAAFGALTPGGKPCRPGGSPGICPRPAGNPWGSCQPVYVNVSSEP